MKSIENRIFSNLKQMNLAYGLFSFLFILSGCRFVETYQAEPVSAPAVVAAIPSPSPSASSSPLPPTVLIFTTQPSSFGTAGALLSIQPQVSIQDAHGNISSSAIHSITLAAFTDSGCTVAAAGNFLVTTNPLAASSGVATFSGVKYNKAESIYVKASASGLTSACSTVSAISAAAASKFILSGSSSITSGACSSAFTITTADSLNNTSVVSSNTAANLSGGGAGFFYSDSGCTASVTSVTVVNSTSSKSFYFKNTLTESLILSVTGTLTTSNLPVTITVGGASKLAFTAQPSGAGTAGVNLTTQPQVSIQDANGNNTNVGTDAITLEAFTDSACTAAAAGTFGVTTNPVSASSGMSTFAGVKYNTAESIYIKATASGLTAACSTVSIISAAAGSQLAFTTQPSSVGTAGTNLSAQPVVTVRDAYNNIVTSASNSITLAAFTDSGCTVAAAGNFLVTANPLAASSGVATFSGVKYEKAESIYIKATASGLASACSTVSAISAAAASKLAFSVQPTNTMSGVSINPSVKVNVLDVFNNLVDSSTANVSLAIGTNPNSGTLVGTLSVAAIAGVSTFSNLSINNAAAGYTLVATSAGLTSITSNTFIITSANPAPTVSAVSPTSGALEGGTPVTISGTGFLSNATVTFGNSACTSVIIASSTSITCLTPAQSAGAITVTVTNTDAQSANLTNAYTYTNAPSAIQNASLRLWLKADAITGLSDGASVSSWADSSATGNTVTQATAALKPVYKTNILNGKPVVRFGGLHRLTKNYSYVPTQYTLFFVSRQTGNQPNGYGVPLGLGNIYENTLRVNNAGDLSFGDIGVQESTFETVWSNTSNFILWSIVVPSTGSGKTVTLYRNGTYFGTGTSTATLGGQWTKITLGDFPNQDGYFFDGDMAEILAYSKALTTSERETIENYLNVKYALYGPRIQGLSRWSGSVNGAETLTITGNGFRQGSTATLGSTLCASSTFISASKITCLTPAQSTGLKSVKVTNPDSLNTSAANSYFYQSAPVTDPSDLSGLKFWLRADSSSAWSLGDRVFVWSDSSPNEFLLPQPFSALRPIYNTIAGKSVLQFTGAERLSVATALNPTAYTLFFAAKNSDNHPNGYGIPFSFGSVYENTFRIINATGTIHFGDHTVEETGFENIWTDTTSFVLWSFVVSQTGTSKTVAIYKNGTYLGTGTTTAKLGGAWSKITIGDFSTFQGYFFNGDVYEVLAYDNALSTPNRAAIENYFNTKYGALYKPNILALSRWSGSTAGGDTLSVTGNGYSTNSVISLDLTPCGTTTYVSPTKLTCTSTPAHAAGLVNVVVTNPDNQIATVTNGYSYEASPGTNPSELSSLQYWLRADSNSLYTNGQTTPVLNESSPNNLFSISVPTNALRPTYTTVSGKPILQFNGGQRVSNATALNPSAYTVFLVAKNNGGHPAGYGVSFSLGNGYPNTMRVLNGSNDVIYGNAAVEESSFSGVWGTTTPYIITVSVPTAGASQTVKLYRNGTYLGTGSTTASTGGAWDQITLGDYASFNGYFMKMNFYEIVIFNAALSDPQITSILNFLNTKYALY